MYVCIHKRLRPIPPGLGSRIWSLGIAFSDLPNPQIGS